VCCKKPACGSELSPGPDWFRPLLTAVSVNEKDECIPVEFFFGFPSGAGGRDKTICPVYKCSVSPFLKGRACHMSYTPLFIKQWKGLNMDSKYSAQRDTINPSLPQRPRSWVIRIDLSFAQVEWLRIIFSARGHGSPLCRALACLRTHFLHIHTEYSGMELGAITFLPQTLYFVIFQTRGWYQKMKLLWFGVYPNQPPILPTSIMVCIWIASILPEEILGFYLSCSGWMNYFS
jgi:hypothetical protein